MEPVPASGRRRVRAVFLATLFVFSLFAVQLLRLQSGLQVKAGVTRDAQTMLSRTKVLTAPRGRILDRDDIELAGNKKRYDVAASQRDVAQYVKRNPQTKKREPVGVAGAAADLAPLLQMSPAQLQQLLTPAPGQPPKGYVPLRKRLEPDVWRQIKALGIPGVYENEVGQRAYPSGASVAPILGFEGYEAAKNPADKSSEVVIAGGQGLEKQYQDTLKATPGSLTREYSTDDRVIPLGASTVTPPVPGRDVKLFLQRDVQWYAYNTIAEQVRVSEAEWGVVVVMDREGHLLGLAQYPSFDPARPIPSTGAITRSLGFQDTFEPGSTAKVMSIGAALAEGKVTPQTPFTVTDTIKRSDRTFRDAHKHKPERLTVAGILAQSSNTGTIQVGEQVAPDRLERYYRQFGLGELSATGWSGETRGIMTSARDWSGSQRFTVMFGQGLAISAIQAAGVFQTVANDGIRVPATLVEGEVDQDGVYQRHPQPAGVQVISPQVAGQLRRMMESVVGTEGTAQAAEVPGYRVAGKTGTSYIYRNGKQAGYTASFIGMAPAERPELIVAAIVQDPQDGYYGGVAAAPAFRKVMTYALRKAGIPPSTQPPTPYELIPGVAPSQRRQRLGDGRVAEQFATTTSGPNASGTATQPSPEGVKTTDQPQGAPSSSRAENHSKATTR